MQIAMICAQCGKIHNNEAEGTLVVDFKKKYMSFICQNKECKHDNIISFDTWQKQQEKSPLPRLRTM